MPFSIIDEVASSVEDRTIIDKIYDPQKKAALVAGTSCERRPANSC